MFYEYQVKGSHRMLEINMAKRNFAHLCGVNYKYGAVNFVRDICRSRVNERNVLYTERKEIVAAKADIMPSLEMLVKPGVRVTDGALYLNLSFDHSLRPARDIFALTLVEGTPGILIPNSLLNLNYSKGLTNGFRNSYEVTRLYSVSIKTGSIYTYFNKP